MIIAGVVWTLVIAVSLIWNWRRINQGILTLAASEARSSYQKDLLYRRWASLHGGVYVPISEIAPPNPYLDHLEERDVVTTDGRELTLINPAYMTRQVQEGCTNELSCSLSIGTA
jgi:hypothetical protein